MNIKRNGIKEGICISFFEIVHSCVLSHVHPYVTPWTAICQAPLFMEFSRLEYWSELPFPTPGDLPNPGIKPTFLVSSALAGRFFTAAPPRKPKLKVVIDISEKQ